MEAVPLDACTDLSVDLTNRIGFVIRSPEGNCSFSSQAYRLNEANATAVVIMNTYKSGEEDSLFSLSDSSSGHYDVRSKTIDLGLTLLSFAQYIILMLFILFIMWGGLGAMYYLSRLSTFLKKRRRKQFVHQIKTRRFHAKKSSDAEEQPTCSICLCPFEEKEMIKKLRCGHYFHCECIDPWLLNNKAVCPVCRRGIFDNDEWNALEEEQNRNIELIMNRVEQRMTFSLSNLFTFVFCIFVVGYPLTLAILSSSCLVVLICISIAAAYGPAFILSNKGAEEVYENSLTETDKLRAMASNITDNYIMVVMNNVTKEISLEDIHPFYDTFSMKVVVPHFAGELPENETTIVNSVEELERLKRIHKSMVLEYRVGSSFVPPTPAKLEDTNGSGVPMTPTVMFALLVVFTLAYAFYFSVDCVSQVQTPTAYTDKVLAVGKEY
ncbi:hypothetical protein BLSTO_00871 [Blastocystis sp. subtype 1]